MRNMKILESVIRYAVLVFAAMCFLAGFYNPAIFILCAIFIGLYWTMIVQAQHDDEQNDLEIMEREYFRRKLNKKGE